MDQPIPEGPIQIRHNPLNRPSLIILNTLSVLNFHLIRQIIEEPARRRRFTIDLEHMLGRIGLHLLCHR